MSVIPTVEAPEGPAVRELREELGVSREDLAEALGVSPSLVKRWELGSHEIRPGYWMALLWMRDRTREAAAELAAAALVGAA